MVNTYSCSCNFNKLLNGHNDDNQRTVFSLPKKEEMANMWTNSLTERIG